MTTAPASTSDCSHAARVAPVVRTSSSSSTVAPRTAVSAPRRTTTWPARLRARARAPRPTWSRPRPRRTRTGAATARSPASEQPRAAARARRPTRSSPRRRRAAAVEGAGITSTAGSRAVAGSPAPAAVRPVRIAGAMARAPRWTAVSSRPPTSVRPRSFHATTSSRIGPTYGASVHTGSGGRPSIRSSRPAAPSHRDGTPARRDRHRAQSTSSYAPQPAHPTGRTSLPSSTRSRATSDRSPPLAVDLATGSAWPHPRGSASSMHSRRRHRGPAGSAPVSKVSPADTDRARWLPPRPSSAPSARTVDRRSRPRTARVRPCRPRS
jgi:hypothetical protein